MILYTVILWFEYVIGNVKLDAFDFNFHNRCLSVRIFQWFLGWNTFFQLAIKMCTVVQDLLRVWTTLHNAFYSTSWLCLALYWTGHYLDHRKTSPREFILEFLSGLRFASLWQVNRSNWTINEPTFSENKKTNYGLPQLERCSSVSIKVSSLMKSPGTPQKSWHRTKDKPCGPSPVKTKLWRGVLEHQRWLRQWWPREKAVRGSRQRPRTGVRIVWIQRHGSNRGFVCIYPHCYSSDLTCFRSSDGVPTIRMSHAWRENERLSSAEHVTHLVRTKWALWLLASAGSRVWVHGKSCYGRCGRE